MNNPFRLFGGNLFQEGGMPPENPADVVAEAPEAQQIAQQFLEQFQQLPPDAQQLIVQALTQQPV